MIHAQLTKNVWFSCVDPNLTVQHVTDVLSTLERNWYYSPDGSLSLCQHLDVPFSKEAEIRRQHQSQQLASLAAYIVQTLPGISWASIAGALYHCCEKRALQSAKRYIKREEGKFCAVMKMTITTCTYAFFYLIS